MSPRGRRHDGTADPLASPDSKLPARTPLYTFRTRQLDDPPGTPRTFGAVVGSMPAPLRFGCREAIELPHPHPPVGCAHGKLAVFTGDALGCAGRCFQLSDCRSRAGLVGCCNATAAIAAAHARWIGRREFEIRVELPGGIAVRVSARVEPGEGTEEQVGQVWSGIPASIRSAGGDGACEYAVCTGALNDYLVVWAKRPRDFDAFGIADAVALARHFGLAREPLRSRVALVESSRASAPRTRFFTCGDREHPSAPLTGLAVLALASVRLGWSCLRGAGRVQTRRGTLALPRVWQRGDGSADVEFAPLCVGLQRVPYGGAREATA